MSPAGRQYKIRMKIEGVDLVKPTRFSCDEDSQPKEHREDASILKIDAADMETNVRLRV